jgi:hypothetical protein
MVTISALIRTFSRWKGGSAAVEYLSSSRSKPGRAWMAAMTSSDSRVAAGDGAVQPLARDQQGAAHAVVRADRLQPRLHGRAVLDQGETIEGGDADLGVRGLGGRGAEVIAGL